jgi:hypothetical protein
MEKDATASEGADLATTEPTKYQQYYALHREKLCERVKAYNSVWRQAGQRVLDHCVATGERDLQAAALAVDLAGQLEEAGTGATPERVLGWVAARLRSRANREATDAARRAELDGIERLVREVAEARARWEAAKAKEQEEAEALRIKISQELAARRVLSQRAIHKEIHRRKAALKARVRSDSPTDNIVP